MSIILVGDDAPKKLNELSREQMKKKLLNDILIDMEISKLEGWDILEYLKDLKKLIDSCIKASKE